MKIGDIVENRWTGNIGIVVKKEESHQGYLRYLVHFNKGDIIQDWMEHNDLVEVPCK